MEDASPFRFSHILVCFWEPVHMERAGSVKRAGPPRWDLSCIMINIKNATCVHMRSGPARLTEISPETAEMEISHVNRRRWASPVNRDENVRTAHV